MKILNAATVFEEGAECLGWNSNGDIEVALNADEKHLTFIGVVGDDGNFWEMPIRVPIDPAFLSFLRGEGPEEVEQEGYILRRCDCCNAVAIGGD